MNPPLRKFAAVQNNGPDYWIISDRAFGGNVVATTNSEEKADMILRACNSHAELLETVKDIERWFSDELISSRHTRLGELVLEKLRPVIAKVDTDICDEPETIERTAI